MPCAWLSLDAMDISGEMHLDVVSAAAAVLPCAWLLNQSAQLAKAASFSRTRPALLRCVRGARLALQASQSIRKQRLSAAGKPVGDAEQHDVTHTRKDHNKTQPAGACGSCYGAETATQACCNTCEEVGSA